MAIKVKELTEQASIDEYLNRFSQLVGVTIPAEYIRRGTVYGCYDGRGRLVGGYTLVTSPPYRGVVFLPDHVRNSHWLFQSVTLNHVLEVNGLWLEANIRLSAKDWYAFWWKMLRSIGHTRKRYVLIWHNDLNRHLHRLYGRMQREVVYTGRSQPTFGETTHPQICVAYTTRWKLYCSLLKLLPRLLRIRATKLWRGISHELKTRPPERRHEDRKRFR